MTRNTAHLRMTKNMCGKAQSMSRVFISSTSNMFVSTSSILRNWLNQREDMVIINEKQIHRSNDWACGSRPASDCLF